PLPAPHAHHVQRLLRSPVSSHLEHAEYNRHSPINLAPPPQLYWMSCTQHESKTAISITRYSTEPSLPCARLPSPYSPHYPTPSAKHTFRTIQQTWVPIERLTGQHTEQHLVYQSSHAPFYLLEFESGRALPGKMEPQFELGRALPGKMEPQFELGRALPGKM